VCDTQHTPLPSSRKNNVSGSGDPRRGGANSRVQGSPQGRVERSGSFYSFLLHHHGFRDVVVSLSTSSFCTVVSFFSFALISSTFPTTKKFHQRVSFKKLTTTFFSSLHLSRFSILTAPTMRFGAFYYSSSSSFKPPLLCAGS